MYHQSPVQNAILLHVVVVVVLMLIAAYADTLWFRSLVLQNVVVWDFSNSRELGYLIRIGGT